jgi:hypothetical protein
MFLRRKSGKRNREDDPDLPSLREEVAAMKADVTTMKANVAKMTTELEAMKCAQVGSPCPDGFDLSRFKYFVKQRKSAATQFQDDICEQQKRVDAKENDIRTEENRIDAKENDIRNQQPRTTRAPSFADVEEACTALRQSSHRMHASPTTLSFCASWYNQDAIKRGLLEGIKRVLTAWKNSNCDKSQVPLLCVLGTMGQGKTDTLMHCRLDEILRKDIIDVVTTRTQQQGSLHLLTLFATFNQDSTYDVLFEPDVQSALCNRLLADYLDVAFSADHTRQFEYIPLKTLIGEIRKLEATKRGCKPDNICIMILVDEMRKLGNEANMRDVLDALNAAQQGAIAGGKLTFAVATCLDVEGICSLVTRVSGRPLHAIPLLPCKSTDIDDFVEKCWASALLKKHMVTVDDRELLLWRAHATGGHFRSLEALWNHFLTTGSVPPFGHSKFISTAYALEIVARQLHSPVPKLFLCENYMIGTVFAHIPKLRTLYDVATNVLHQQAFYKEVNVVGSTVCPCVSPLSLCESLPSDDDTDVAKGIVQVLRQQILARLTATKREWIKGWEVAIPLLEAVVATMIHEVDVSSLNKILRSVHSEAPVAMDRVFRTAVVQHWDPKRPVELQYSHGCRNFMELWSPNLSDRRVKTRRHHDTAALKEVCQATTPLLCLAITDNYPVEGVHTMLEAAPAGTRQVIPVVFQMKACATVTATDVKNWADAAHAHARKIFGLHKKKYYVMLYLTAHFDESWRVAVPKGTVVIDAAALERVLEPFGATPFLTALKGRDQ